MNKVQIFYASIKSFSQDEYLSLLSNLPEIKKESINRLISQNEKNASLSAYLLLKEALIRNDIDIGDYEYIVGPNGKPSLNGCRFKFSISHSGGICVVAIGEENLGVDVEEIKTRSSKVQKIFTDKDREYIANSNDHLLAFHQIWTAKEAYVKALGTGLSTSVNSFEVVDVQKERLMGFSLEGDYVGAVYSLTAAEFGRPTKTSI